MLNLQTRSSQKELLDIEDIPFKDIQQNMKELNSINHYLGGHWITLRGIKKLLPNYKNNRTIVVCEIGCGGGDNLQVIHQWCKQKSIDMRCIGIDIKAACIEYARKQYPHLNANWITADFADVDFGGEKPDIIFSSLFCHHFSETSVVNILRWMQENSQVGFFINDLHRHSLAYHSIKIITQIFSGSYLVKNDAPLSVARGFTRSEWQNMIRKADLKDCSIHWRWAFRFLIIYRTPADRQS